MAQLKGACCQFPQLVPEPVERWNQPKP